MSQQANFAARLREGIDAARRGDKITARRLLLQVLSTDANNELALMWMASVVDTLNERRFYLERALQVNPENARAREALRRLGVEQPETVRTSPAVSGDFGRRAPRGDGGTNLYLIGASVVAIIVIAVLVASAVSSSQQPAPTQNVQATFSALLNPSATPTIDLNPPTAIPTVLPGVIASMNPDILTPLPPTFTPTFTLTPTETLTPSPTPFPLSNFTMLYADIESGASVPSLYQGKGDGTGETKLQAGDAGGFKDIAVDHSGQQIAFVRAVTDSANNSTPQLFVAPLNSLADAKQITTLKGTTLAHPSWSPDGSHIIFSSNDSGYEEIEQVNADGTNIQALTSGQSRNFDPSFSPDGKQIVYASDSASPGFTEIYVMDFNGAHNTELTVTPNCYAPAWSPDGTQIAYVSDSGGQGDIYVMDADGQQSTLITFDDNNAENNKPVWSPDGRWIFFATNRDGQSTRWYATDLQSNAKPITVSGRNPDSLVFINP